jgi:hypothetical protein
MEVWIWSQVSVVCVIYGGQSGIRTGSAQNISVFPCPYDSTNASFSFIFHQHYIILGIDSVVK